MTKIGDLLASITGEPSPTQAAAPPLPLPIKRKASDGDPLRRPVDKLQRVGSGTSSSNTSRPLTESSKPLAVDTSMSKMRLSSGSNGKAPVLSPAASSTFKNGRPTPPLNDAPARVAMPVKPPKKGSYAEIMARGKVAQATMGQVGKIQHKPIQKLPSKKEREEMAAQKSAKMQKNIGPGGKFRNTPDAQAIKGKGETSKGMLKDKRKGAPPPEPEKKVKKAATATTGYAGTARPKPGAGKLPSKSSGQASSRYGKGPNRDRDRYRDDRYSSSKRYTYASEEEDDEEEEEEEGYGSDASSDMEAAAFEVDEEEELATRIARKEDAEALAEENRLKREKAEKKRRLEAMARKRR